MMHRSLESPKKSRGGSFKNAYINKLKKLKGSDEIKMGLSDDCSPAKCLSFFFKILTKGERFKRVGKKRSREELMNTDDNNILDSNLDLKSLTESGSNPLNC